MVCESVSKASVKAQIAPLRLIQANARLAGTLWRRQLIPASITATTVAARLISTCTYRIHDIVKLYLHLAIHIGKGGGYFKRARGK